MSDRLKFKIWFPDEKDMMTPDTDGNLYVHMGGSLYYINHNPWTNKDDADKETGPYIILPCTGLYDSNKKLIYDGDIVQGSYGIPPVSVRSVVEYRDGAYYINTEGHWPSEALLKEGIECLQLEIIGNIHENPELLGEG